MKFIIRRFDVWWSSVLVNIFAISDVNKNKKLLLFASVKTSVRKFSRFRSAYQYDVRRLTNISFVTVVSFIAVYFFVEYKYLGSATSKMQLSSDGDV